MTNDRLEECIKREMERFNATIGLRDALQRAYSLGRQELWEELEDRVKAMADLRDQVKSEAPRRDYY